MPASSAARCTISAHRYNRTVIEQASIAGVLNPRITGNVTTANAAADYIARRLDALADEVERGWTGRFAEGEGFFFERTVRGVKDVAIIDDALLGFSTPASSTITPRNCRRPIQSRVCCAARTPKP